MVPLRDICLHEILLSLNKETERMCDSKYSLPSDSIKLRHGKLRKKIPFVSSKEPVKNGREVIYEMFHKLNCGF